MKRIFIVGLIIFMSTLSAQTLEYEIQESKVYKMTTLRVQNDYIIPDGKGGFVTISTKRSGFLANPLVFESYATYYDNDLTQIKQETFKLNKGSIKGSIKGAFIDKGKLKMINLETNYRKRYISFKQIEQDISTGETQEKEFFRINQIYSKNEVNLYINMNSLYYEKLKYYSDVNFFNPKIFIKFSDNNQYFAIVYRSFEKIKAQYIVNIYDKNFNQIFTGSIFDNINPELFYINDIVVDDANGDTYIVVKVLEEKLLSKKRLINSNNLQNFTLYKVTKEEVQSLNIEPGKVIEELHLIKGNNQLVTYGFYRNRFMDVNDIDGIFRMNIETSSFQKTSDFYDNFSKKLVTSDYEKLRKKTKNHKMIVRKSYLLSDGSLLINSEDFYIPLMMQKRNRETDIREIVGNIFTIKINEQGKVLWSKGIYKEQIVKPRLALHSFFSVLYNTNNYIFFTDSRIYKQDEKSEPFYLNGKDLQNLYGVEINENGNIKIGLVKDNKRSKFRYMPIEGIKITTNEIIIPAKDHQYIKFYKIKLK